MEKRVHVSVRLNPIAGKLSTHIVVGLPRTALPILLLTKYPSIPPSLCKRIPYPDDKDFEGFIGNEGTTTAQNVHLTNHHGIMSLRLVGGNEGFDGEYPNFPVS